MSKFIAPEQTGIKTSTPSAPAVSGSSVRRKSEWFYLKKNAELLLLLSPGTLLIFIFAYIPMFGVILAFKDFRYDKGIFGSDWIGFKNFEFLFVSENAWRITRNTILYESAYLISTTIIALVFAILMNEMGR